MHKFFIVSAFTLTLVACGSNQASPYEKQKLPENQTSSANQVNKIKCQDARLDLVEAEAEGDINMIRQVKARVQKLCVTNKE